MPSFTCPNIAIPLSVRQMPPYTCPNVRQRQLEIADPRFGARQHQCKQAGRQCFGVANTHTHCTDALLQAGNAHHQRKQAGSATIQVEHQ